MPAKMRGWTDGQMDNPLPHLITNTQWDFIFHPQMTQMTRILFFSSQKGVRGRSPLKNLRNLRHLRMKNKIPLGISDKVWEGIVHLSVRPPLSCPRDIFFGEKIFILQISPYLWG